jgi:uncharacterized protein YigA (DUF484 family)
VAAYLRKHPNFFVEHPEVLAELAVPHAEGGAVSLVERQIAILREQNKRIQERYQELLVIGRENERLVRRLHRLTLRLVAATGPERFFQTLYNSLSNDFKADLMALKIFADAGFKGPQPRPEFVGKDHPDQALFSSTFKTGKPFCGQLRPTQWHALFGQTDRPIGSAALIPLSGKQWKGVLAIGSYDPKRYFPTMGVDLLEQLGEIVSLILDPWVAR